MAQTNYTPISLYYSTTASQAPLAANLVNGELAINITDGKLYYKDNGGVVKVLAGSGGTGIVAGSNTQIQFNNSGVFGASSSLTWDGTYLTAGSIKDSALTSGRVTYAGASGLLQDSVNLTFNGTTLTANTLNLTNALTTTYGGTGLTSFTAGDLPYYATGTALSKLGIGTAGNYLSSSGTAPQWSAPAALTKTDDTNVTLTLGGSASTALLNAASLTLGWTGQLSVARGGTNATATPTAGAVAYGTGTAYAFTSAGTSNQVLISNGSSAPSWSNLSSLGVTSLSFGTTGLTPSTATQGAITVAGTLATTNGGTGLTSFTANGVVYASSTSALTTGSALTFDGSALTLGGTQRINGTTTSGLLLTSNSVSSNGFKLYNDSTTDIAYLMNFYNGSMVFGVSNAEQMRLTSTGLGIGTSSPASKLDVSGTVSVSGTGALVRKDYGYSASYKAIQIGAPSSASQNVALAVDVSTVAGGNFIGQNQVILPNNGALFVNAAGTNFLGAIARDSSNRILIGPNLASGVTSGDLVIDSSGNLGLGVTPSAWYSTYKALQVGSSGSMYNAGTNDFIMSSNAYVNATGTYTYLNTTTATYYEQYAGKHIWANAPSGTAGNAITFTQAMTLDASGQLVIGSTTANAQLEVYKSNASGFSGIRVNNPSGSNGTGVEMGIDWYNATNYHGRISAFRDNNEFRINNNQAGALTFYTSNTERARIDSSGNFLVGTTSTGFTSSLSTYYTPGVGYWINNHSTGTASGTRYAGYGYGINEIGSITQSGTTAVLYNTTSDQRLKENITDADSASNLIDAIKVRQFDWKSDGTHQRYGMVAQELYEVAPEAVHAPQDPDAMMAVDYSKLVPMLIKELQSLRARVAQLEAK